MIKAEKTPAKIDQEIVDQLSYAKNYLTIEERAIALDNTIKLLQEATAKIMEEMRTSMRKNEHLKFFGYKLVSLFLIKSGLFLCEEQNKVIEEMKEATEEMKNGSS